MNNNNLLEALQEAAETIDSLLDYVGDSNAIRMIGARERYAEARTLLYRIYALLDASEAE